MFYFFLTSLFFFQFFNLTAHVNFIHIPKCGGTTIEILLEKFYSVSEIYYKNMMFFVTNPQEIEFFSDKIYDINHKLVEGHIPFWFLKEKDPDFQNSFKFTVLRSPIERVISDYNYRIYCNTMANNYFETQANYMCKMLCSNPYLEGEALLEDCKKNLSDLDLVIFLDDFQAGIEKLFNSLGLELKEDKILKLNECIGKKEKFSKEFLNHIAKLNDLDIKLYEFAQEKFRNKKINKYPLSLKFLETLYEPKDEIIYTFDMPAIQKGWNRRENIGTSLPISQWVNVDKASIFFCLKQGLTYQINFLASTLSPEAFPILLVNNKIIKLKKTKTNTDGIFKYQGIIHRNIISNCLTEFTFFHPKPMRVNEIWPSIKDSRLVSIALHGINISPIKHK